MPTPARLKASQNVTPERFWSKVDKRGSDECWPWLAATVGGGYGQFRLDGNGRSTVAHRVAYELLKGPIPDGLYLDHLCRNRACVNPAHLEPVTNGENVLRGQSPSAINAGKTHCKHGHPFNEENTYWRRTGGRMCRQCKRDTERCNGGLGNSHKVAKMEPRQFREVREDEAATS